MHRHATNTVPVPVVSTDSMSAEMDFGFDGADGDQLVKLSPLNLRLQWLNGLNTTTREVAIGFHIEAEVNPQLDEILASMGVKRYMV